METQGKLLASSTTGSLWNRGSAKLTLVFYQGMFNSVQICNYEIAIKTTINFVCLKIFDNFDNTLIFIQYIYICTDFLQV